MISPFLRGPEDCSSVVSDQSVCSSLIASGTQETKRTTITYGEEVAETVLGLC